MQPALQKPKKMFNKMWSLGKSASATSCGTRTKETLSDDLHNEVRLAAPGARLSYFLRKHLELLDKNERKEIVSIVGKQDGCSPLFISCKKGNLEIVEYLIEVCGAEIEQKGTYEVLDDKTTHKVSPLWCSAVSGRLNVVKLLIKHGADVDSVSDTGSTPVRSACFMTHNEIVQYLVESAGADIQLPNYNGGTCLINSVQSSLLCEYLLSKGANVNSQDIQLKSALHYAIQEHRFETTKLLLSNGANPNLKNRYGDDALQTSSLKGATTIFNYLLENVPGYTPEIERQADMHELMGSTFLDEHHDIQMALFYWKKALSIRKKANPPICKKLLSYTPLYARIINQDGNESEIKEFSSEEELESISTDLDQIRISSLLIAERILGKNHKDVIFRVMYRGAAYADSSAYSLCIRLWRYALQLRILKDSLLFGDTCFTALALIRLYLDLDRNRELDRTMIDHPLTIEDLIGTYQLLINELPSCIQLIKIRPVFKRQLESFDRCLRCCTHLLHLLLKAPHKTPDQIARIKLLTKSLIGYKPKMCSSSDTLLHLAVTRNNIVRSHFFVDEQQVYVFPSYEVAKYLIKCGADVNTVNSNLATPLHISVSNENFNCHTVNLLLKHGSHYDQLDAHNLSPYEILKTRHVNYEFPSYFDHISLRCITSRYICSKGIQFKEGDIPRELNSFVELHRPVKNKNGSDLLSPISGKSKLNRLPNVNGAAGAGASGNNNHNHH